MTRGAWWTLLPCLFCAASLQAGTAGAASTAAPTLALALVGGGDEPGLLLAQRSIEREWGPSEDSLYTTVDVPGWRSPGMAFALSGAVPGAGQLYAGSATGWWFALAEAVGWSARWVYLSRGHELKDDAVTYSGAPTDTTSLWSFERWEQTTGSSAAGLRVLYAGDPEVFYDRMATDPDYLPGWQGEPTVTRQKFTDLRQEGETRLNHAKTAETGLWLNHVVAAFDALRLAKLKNVRLGPDTDLRLGSGWRHGGPQFSAAVRRTF